MSCCSAYRLLDVGGTFVKCADGRQVPIPSDGSRDAIAAALTQAIGPVEGLKGVGIAIPGPFDYAQGIFLMKHKFPAVYGCSFRELTRLPESADLRFHHDVNAQLRGAVRLLGLEKGNTALVTLGTGFGFAYAIGGQVRYNEAGSPARSLWNVPMEGGGILEDQISARGIRASYVRLTGNDRVSVHAIAQRAYGGEEAALEVFSDLGDRLGEALDDPVQELGIDTLLMGGQIAKSLSLMLRPLQNRLEGIRILAVPDGAVFEGLSTLFENE